MLRNKSLIPQIYRFRMLFSVLLIPLVILLQKTNYPMTGYSLILVGFICFMPTQLVSLRMKRDRNNWLSVLGDTLFITGVIINTGWYESPFLFLFLLLPATYGITISAIWAYYIFFLYLPIMGIILLAAAVDGKWGWFVYTLVFLVVFFMEVDTIYKWFSDSTEQIILLKEKANRDPLTGLFNRYVIDDLIERLVDENGLQEICSVVILDLDDFKQKNDLYGHPVGDQILIKVSEVLQENIRNKDILLRYGGDEFLLLFWDINRGEALNIINRIKEKIFEKTGCQVSEGIESGYIKERADILRLISAADEDMYKHKGKTNNPGVL